MNIKKNDLKVGTVLIEKKPSEHTEKLHKMEIKSIHSYYNHRLRRQSTYYICMTCMDSHYLAANSTERHPMYLDGLMGHHDLSEIKRDYILFKP